MSTQTCLYCFESFDIREMLVRCQLNDDDVCPFVEDDPYRGFWLNQKELRQPRLTGFGEGRILKRLSRLDRQYPCSHCRQLSDLLCCPHCHNALPHPEDRRNEIILSLLGPTQSGKTTYLGLLCQEFNQTMAPIYSLQPHNEEVRDRYRERYEQPLKELSVPPSTKETAADSDVRHPLIFELRQSGEAAQSKRLLVLHDAAGEQFADRLAVRRFNRYVTHSHGMLLFLDAEQAPAVRARMSDPPSSGRRSSTDILNTVTRVITNDRNLPSARLAIPLAVVLSKLDVLGDASIIGEPQILTRGFELLEPSAHGPALSRSETRNVSGEIKSLLVLLGARALIGAVGGLFDSSAYFGVSALGHSPDHETGKLKHEAKPLRLADPLLWLLARLDAIETTD